MKDILVEKLDLLCHKWTFVFFSPFRHGMSESVHLLIKIMRL